MYRIEYNQLFPDFMLNFVYGFVSFVIAQDINTHKSSKYVICLQILESN